MDKISIEVLNPEIVQATEKMMVFCARLTQKGHTIKNMHDLKELYNKGYLQNTVKTMVNLPHPTIQKFGVINVAIVGASRRFLAQITRHQNEVKFMSASLQYSDYSDDSDFCVPYEIMARGQSFVKYYLARCKEQMEEYKNMIKYDAIDHDAAGYLAPQGLRNILIISATPYQWKHMIGQRGCRRNTKETQYIMLKIWEQLYNLNPTLFGLNITGPGCMRGKCLEGKMCCGRAIKKTMTPSEILKEDFPLFYEMSKEN